MQSIYLEDNQLGNSTPEFRSAPLGKEGTQDEAVQGKEKVSLFDLLCQVGNEEPEEESKRGYYVKEAASNLAETNSRDNK